MVAFTFKKQVVSKPADTIGVLNDVQDSCLEIVRGLNSIELNQSVFLTNVSLSTTSKTIAHNLGYKARGFICVNPSASFNVFEDTTAANPDSTRFIMLRTSTGSYTVSLIIF